MHARSRAYVRALPAHSCTTLPRNPLRSSLRSLYNPLQTYGRHSARDGLLLVLRHDRDVNDGVRVYRQVGR